MSDFWESGSLPHPAELRKYLETQGVKGESIDQIVNDYETMVVGTASFSTWNEDQVNEWVESQIGGKIARDVAQTGPPDPQSMLDEMVAQRESADEVIAAEHSALGDQRTEVARAQVQSYYDQVASVGDAGSAYGSTLATSIALGYQTDEYGNFVRDEYGAPIPIRPEGLWEEIRGQTFNMGSLSMPYTSKQRLGGPGSEYHASTLGRGRRRPLDDKDQRFSGRTQAELMAGYDPSPEKVRTSRITPSQALAMLTSMDEDHLAALQQELWEAGIYDRVAGEGAIPTWGRADVATRKAFIEMFTEASLDPREPISDLLNRLADERISRMEAPETGPGASGTNLPDFMPEVTSAEVLGETIDEIAQNLRGEFASDEEKQTLISKLQEKEVNYQRQQYDRTISDAVQQAGGAGAEEIDRFMAAIAGKESGGNYNAVNVDSGAHGKFQIMPGNWRSWAQRAGLSPEAPRTPENQEIVARRIMLDYYKQFGNWRDVAVAWYSGPGNVAKLRNSTRPQGGGKYPSIAAYADDIMGRFAKQGPLGPGDQVYGADVHSVIERFDPAAEARAILKAQDPAGWQAHEFADRAIEFYSLLGGVV